MLVTAKDLKDLFKFLVRDIEYAKSKTKGVWPKRLDRVLDNAKKGDKHAFFVLDQELRPFICQR